MIQPPQRVRADLPWALTLFALCAAGALEAQVYSFERASYGVAEGAGQVEICVVRTGDLSNRIDALVSTFDGTATSGGTGGSDFFPWSDAPFQFPPQVAAMKAVASPGLRQALEREEARLDIPSWGASRWRTGSSGSTASPACPPTPPSA